MGQPFTEKMLEFFQCEIGAFSVVTNTEFEDKQATFTGLEKKLAQDFFGDAMAVKHGSKKVLLSQNIDPYSDFRIFPVGTHKRVRIGYKTGQPNELRIYFTEDTFKPLAGEFWLVFVKAGEIWLAALTESTLHGIEIGSIKPRPRQSILEEEADDAEYQDEVNGTPPAQRLVQQLSWVRNPLIARTALISANFSCELKPSWPTFSVRDTGNFYVEAHHLIPLSRQPLFEGVNLDTAENVCVLNPTCHRMLHLAALDTIEHDLMLLISRRTSLLDRLGINKYDVLSYYS